MSRVDGTAVRSVAVLGLGLIGGSVARRLVPDYDVIGYDSDPETRSAAAAAGIPTADSIVDAVAGRELVVLAVPLPEFEAVLAAVAEAVGEAVGEGTAGAVVTDVASVKAPAVAAARATLGPAARFVGGHPMAGSERSGFGASDARLFDGAAWVLCLEPDTDLAAWLTVARIVAGFGCRIVPCLATAHDAAVARVSGLPHLLALTLAVTGADGGPLALALAAGSFRDGTRVADTRPGLITALCDSNRDALADVVDSAIDRLAEARDALRSGGTIAPLAAAGHAARRRWTATGLGGRTSTVDISAATDPRSTLLGVGAAGGHLTAVSGTTLECWLPPTTT
jgi:prephenate dehydrogenase